MNSPQIRHYAVATVVKQSEGVNKTICCTEEFFSPFLHRDKVAEYSTQVLSYIVFIYSHSCHTKKSISRTNNRSATVLPEGIHTLTSCQNG